MTRRGIPILTLILFLCSNSLADSDEVSDAERGVATARDEHTVALMLVRDDVAKKIKSRIDKEQKQKKPSLGQIKILQREQVALGSDIFPTWIDSNQKRRIKAASSKLVSSMEKLKDA